MQRRMGNFESIPAIQFSNDDKDTSNAIVKLLGSTWQNTNGVLPPSAMTAIATEADGRQFMRLGWVTRNSATTVLNLCLQAARFEIEFG